MKKGFFIVGVVAIVLLGSLFLNKQGDSFSLEGMVLATGESEVLMSKRSDLTIEDLEMDEKSWLDGAYELVRVKNISGAQPGMMIRVQVKKMESNSYPQQAVAHSYEVIEHRYVLDEEMRIDSLIELFPTQVGYLQRFSGQGEYGHTQTLSSISESGDTTVIEFKGNMRDGYGQSESRSFLLTYEVSDEEVIEHVQNQDRYSVLRQDNLLSSIIPNKVVLKAPLEVGNQWTESFVYQNVNYEATTEIVRKGLDAHGQLVYETLTTVPNINQDCQVTYKETRRFSVGSGMTAFHNVFSFKESTESGEDSNQAEDVYLFGYALSSDE